MTSTPTLHEAPGVQRGVSMISGALLVAGPFVDYARYHHYPLWTVEVLGIAALSLACGALLGAALAGAPSAVRILGFGMLLFLFVDLQFDLHTRVSFRLIPVALLLLAWLLGRNLGRVLAPALVAFYLAALPRQSPHASTSLNWPNAAADTTLPPMIYLILDGHIGTGGWPAEVASAREMQQRTQQFYLDGGFRVFDRAFSEYRMTRSSIPAALNWNTTDPHRVIRELSPNRQYRLATNEAFRQLSDVGYRIRVYQSSYLDFCDARSFAIRSCETRPANSISNIALLQLPIRSKATLVGLFFLERTSHVYARLTHAYVDVAARHPTWPAWMVRNDWFTFPRAMELLDRLRADWDRDDPRGTVYFAHLLAPHESYVVTSDCAARPLSSLRGDRKLAQARPRTAEERAGRYAYYAAQVGCLYRNLDTFFDAVGTKVSRDGLVAIVHGDHGSLLSVHAIGQSTIGTLDRADVVDNFSTLFAIRAPRIASGTDSSFLSVRELVGRSIESRFTRIDQRPEGPRAIKLESTLDAPFVTVMLSDSALAPRTTPVARQN